MGTDRARGGALSTTGRPSYQNPAPRGKVRAPVPVLQDHQTALPAQHRPAESRRGILHHQPDRKREVGARRSARALPAGREYVVRVPAGRGHAESVGERRPCAGDLRAPAGCGLRRQGSARSG